MFYFKKMIAYLDYYEYGEKRKNCGYIKWLIRDHAANLEIHIKGLNRTESSMCEIYSAGPAHSCFGRFMLDKGTGYYNAEYPVEDIDGKGLFLLDISGVRIRVEEDKYCVASWEWGEAPREYFQVRKEEAPPAAAGPEPAPEASEREAFVLEGEALPEKKPELGAEAMSERAPEPEQGALPKRAPELEQEALPKRAPEPFPPSEDKWQQLCRTYPICQPFGGKEDYISISPKDFIILRKEYQNLVSNSFLLHGFYNYHHVILGKQDEKNEEIYYIGVPGAYYDRDKKVAVMFGFEGFARAVRKSDRNVISENDPIPVGAFGYYMRRVEI